MSEIARLEEVSLLNCIFARSPRFLSRDTVINETRSRKIYCKLDNRQVASYKTILEKKKREYICGIDNKTFSEFLPRRTERILNLLFSAPLRAHQRFNLYKIHESLWLEI